MPQYTVKQIVLTDEIVDQINNMETPEIWKRYLNVVNFPRKAAIQAAYGDYEVVAKIDAENLEDVFRISNLGFEEAITRLAPMHSVSVGDIVVTEDGKEFYVDTFGFKEVWE